MKVAFVVPRYGVEVRGGAEHAARQLAERLVADLGWDAEVLTTCAVDSRTWANELPAGMAMVNGVISVPIMAVMMLLAVKPAVMGPFVISTRLRVLGWLATTVMAAAMVATSTSR